MTHARKILFVCMQNSPHACRWITGIADRGWDLHLFPIDHNAVLPSLRGVTVHPPFLPARRSEPEPASAQGMECAKRLRFEPNYPLVVPHRITAAFSRVGVRTGESEARSPVLYGPRSLARVIRKLQPELIHSMEFQHCGYNVLRAREIVGGDFPPWLATNWGSDIYHFRQFEGHRAQIARLLRHIDYYSCECQRDVGLARELGMTAKVLPVMPNSGGFDLPSAQRLRSLLPTSRRRLIMVKGYQHFAGRVLTALSALEQCADVVRDFDVVIFSPSSEAITRAKDLRARTAIKSVTVLPFATHDQMLRMFAMARVYLGVSVSDAISTSALEAMAMGAFPIQTDTSCCDEWFVHGEGGYLIPPDDVDLIAERVRSALSDDRMVDRAAEFNWSTIASRLDQDGVQQRVWSFYDEIFADLDRLKGSRS